MSRFAKTSKLAIVLFLCLFFVASFMLVWTEEIAAAEYIKEVDITTDQPLYQGADIEKFLESITLNVPGPDHVGEFNYRLYYMDGETQVDVESGNATKSTYFFEIEITLVDGHFFDSQDNLVATFNGIEADLKGFIEAGSPDMTARWNLNPLPRYKVTFDADGGTPVPPDQWVIKGQKVVYPEEPVRPGFEFLGWGQNVPKAADLWDFNQEVHQDLALIARWNPLRTTTTTTVTTTPIVIEVTTTPPEEPTTTPLEVTDPATTESSSESTMASETVAPETSPNENVATTSTSPDTTGEKKGFDFTTILYILGGAALLITLGTIVLIFGRKSK